jgi:hypothetical protein
MTSWPTGAPSARRQLFHRFQYKGNTMNVLQRYTKTLFCSIGFLASAVLAGCGGGDQGRDPILGLPSATVVSLAVTPAVAGIALGATQQFSASATFSDGSVQAVAAAWSSATPAVAGVAATGLATGAGVGATVISAAFNGKSASAALTVTPAALLSIAVTPQAPTVQIAATRQLAVLGTYSDASTLDLTAVSRFVSATPANASVGAGGLVTGAAPGSAVITATSGGKSASTTVTVPAATLTGITVTPAAAGVLIGAVQQFVATATYSDNSTALVTASAAWSSTSPTIGSVGATGLATGVAAGTTTVSASVGARSGSATLTVTATSLPPTVPVVLAVPLGGAADFAVLAGTSLTNNAGGTTLITGNVGAPSQTVDPTLAAGFTNYKSGAILAGALADLQTAISDANGRTCDVSFAGGIDLGGQTFGPGVYCYAGAINITGTVTLSGPGVYIFRSALTLNSTANSVVALGNGATAANVTWVPVGPTTLGANSVFKGTILGQSAAITVGDNTTLLNGRVLSGAAVTLRNNQIAK